MVERHATIIRWKGVSWRAGKRAGEGRSTAEPLAQMLSLFLTLPLTLLCVWESDLNAETRFPQRNMRNDIAHLCELSWGLTQSLANRRHTLKLVPLHLPLKLLQLRVNPWNTKGLCSAGIFSSSTTRDIANLAKNANGLIHLPALFKG